MKKRGRINLKLHKIKTWQLMLILVPLLFLDATLLRMDHIHMTELRDAVLEADASEDDEEVKKRLEALREYTLSNMVINVWTITVNRW